MESKLQCANNYEYSACPTSSAEPGRYAKFVAMLPRIRRQAAYHLRRLSSEDRADAIQEVMVSSFVSYVRLTERGKSDLAYASPLARYGAYQYLRGRRVGSCLNVQDVSSNYCRRKKGVCVERLDRFDEHCGDWEQLVVEDKHSTPANVAATRVDFRAWLEALPERTRRVAEILATGETTGRVARMFGVSASRISQLRRELYQAWRVYQGEVVPAESFILA